MKSSFSSFQTDIAAIDWDFATLGNEGLHSLHWYPATFISAIPGSLIPMITEGGALVADPFCGSATTGVEAIRLGRRFMGFDTNPVAVLIAKAKLSSPDLTVLEEVLLDSSPLLTGALNGRRVLHPNEQALRRWYHPETYSELLGILERIRTLQSPVERVVGQALFSSILKSVCSQTRHWGWVCDNVVPKPEEMQYKSAYEALRAAFDRYRTGLMNICRDMAERGVDCSPEAVMGRSEVQLVDAVRGLNSLGSHSLDAIVTSPPYYGVADYIKSQRLSFLWFHKEVLDIEGFSTADFESLRRTEVGSRSFRHRKTSYDEYLEYMNRFMAACARALKPGAPMCFVFGESNSRKAPASDIDEIASRVGLEVAFSSSRSIRATKRRLMARVPTEEITIYVSRHG
jgi:hypothetical protein